MNTHKLKSLFFQLSVWAMNVSVLLAHHKDSHTGGGGKGKKGAPEIDGNELLLFAAVIVLAYMMYFYWKRNLVKS